MVDPPSSGMGPILSSTVFVISRVWVPSILRKKNSNFFILFYMKSLRFWTLVEFLLQLLRFKNIYKKVKRLF